MRGRLPLPPIPGQTVGGGVPDAPRRLAPTPFPGLRPAETRAAANTPRRGQDPSLRAEALTAVHVTPPGRACPAPTARRPGNGCPRKPCGRFHIPIRRAGCPTPPRPPAAACSRANRRGRRPRRPAEACANGHLPVNHPRRGQDPSLRTEPLTGAHANLRAGHTRPLPCGGPETGVRVNPADVSISPSVGRGAPTPPQAPAAALPRATRRGRRPRRPAKPPANGHPPGNHPQTTA